MFSVDLNCDMGEGFEASSLALDTALMNYVSSVNIACGYHAGDALTMHRTVEAAIKAGVSIGAHPGYDDIENFGRREINLSADEVLDLVKRQVELMKAICEQEGTELRHVKPHGALYNQAARDAELADSIALAISEVDRDLIVYGLSGSRLISASKRRGLRTASEVFADRTYQSDGTLTPRSKPDAFVENANAAAEAAVKMVKEGRITSIGGDAIDIVPDTICIHGDGDHALEMAKTIRILIDNNEINVRPPSVKQ